MIQYHVVNKKNQDSTKFIVFSIVIVAENDIMKYAIKLGFCNVKSINGRNSTFDFSCRERNFRLIRFIIEFGVKCNDITFNDLDLFRLILKIPRFELHEALIWASKKGHHRIIKLHLSVPGIDVNAKDKVKKTALIWTYDIGQHEAVKLLLMVPGLDIKARDYYNNTALIWASMRDHHYQTSPVNSWNRSSCKIHRQRNSFDFGFTNELS